MNPVSDQAKAKGLTTLLLNMLQEVQQDSGIEIVINEGIPADTSGSHVKDSEHFEGNGADVSATDGISRMKIVKSALKIGFKRIGVYTAHVHLGVNTTLPQDVIWGGESH